MYSCTGPLEVSSLMSLPLVLALLFTLSSMQVDAGKRLQARMLIQNHNSSQPEGFVVEAHEDWAPHGYVCVMCGLLCGILSQPLHS